jgi:hypothetical protein
MITVVNRHKSKTVGVYVGRPSALGSKFKLKEHGGNYTREQSIELYRAWLREQWKCGGAAKKMLLGLVAKHQRGEDVVLICSCKPLACHADVIADAIVAICAKQCAK